MADTVELFCRILGHNDMNNLVKFLQKACDSFDKNQLVSISDLDCAKRNENLEEISGYSEKHKNMLGDLLYEAIDDKSERDIKILLRHGADPNYKRPFMESSTFIRYIFHFPEGNLLDLFIERGVDLTLANHHCALHYAAIVELSVEDFEKLLKIGANPCERDEEGNTPLHLVIANLPHSDAAVVISKIRLLLDYGADIEAGLPQILYETPLYVAIECEFLEAVEYLLSRGADPNCGEYGDGLLKAIRCNHIEMVKCLIEHGAKVNVFHDRAQASLLRLAVTAFDDDEQCECCQVLKLLLENGASVNDFDAHSGSPLLLDVLFMKREKIFKLLIEHGATVGDFQTFLQAAVESNLCEAAEILIANTRLEDIDCSGMKTILGAAVENGSEDMVKLLLRSGGKADDASVLEKAAINGQVGVMKLLMASIDLSDLTEGKKVSKANLLMYAELRAACASQPEMLKYLLKLKNEHFHELQYQIGVSHFHSFSECYNIHAPVSSPTFLIVMKYFAMMIILQFPRSLAENNFITVSRMWAECRGKEYITELVNMQNTRVHEEYQTTYFDVLTKSKFAVAKLLCLKKVNATLQSCDFKVMFEHYHEELEDNYLLGLRILRKRNEFRKILQEVFGHIIAPEIITMISEYQS